MKAAPLACRADWRFGLGYCLIGGALGVVVGSWADLAGGGGRMVGAGLGLLLGAAAGWAALLHRQSTRRGGRSIDRCDTSADRRTET